MLRSLLSLLFCTLLTVLAHAQKRSLPATRTGEAPRIDGDLSDPAWASAPVATGFIQNFPVFGKPAARPSAVRVLYDDVALYVSAYLYDDSALIRRQLTPRDGESRQDVDYFSVFLDTYKDHQNGFQFLVTTANVQSDARLGTASSDDFGDKTWDAVWQSATAMRPDGWTVEMRIPYISLRFSSKEVQTWGLQFLRFTRRDNASDYWNPVNPSVNGFVNQFGILDSLRAIRSPLRLSLSPYVSGGVRFNPESGKRTEFLRSGGMDVKWGVNKSFTLDATLIPDFGQVISDNVVNNLTPYEIRFQENRPFFTEGTELFNKSGIFYSRRVGSAPVGYGLVEGAYGNSNHYEIEQNPSVTQLLNAVKFSGRTDKKLGIGVFNAVTAPMHARVRNLATKELLRVETEPLTNYNLFVLDQAFRGRSSVTFTNASVIRNGSARDANTSSLDWALYNKANSYAVSGSLRSSHIFGYTYRTPSDFTNTDTVSRDGKAYLKPYDGFAARLRIAKVGGRWRWFGQVNMESDKYDPNDLGYLQAPNEVYYTAGVSFTEFSPTRHFITYNYGLSLYQNNLYKPYAYSSFEAVANGYVVFHNFWDVGLTLGALLGVQTDFFELRNFNYRLRRPAFYYANLQGSSDSRRKLFVSFGVGYEHSTLARSPYCDLRTGIRYRFSNRFTLSLDLARQHDKLQIGSAYQADPGIVGYRDYKDLTSVLSGIYNFTPRMNLTLRARHYWSQVHYLDFFKVDAKGDPRPIGFIPGQDQNFNIFNLDAFYTWDFRPGSRVILGWKNWLNATTAIDGIKYKDYGRNLSRSFQLPHINEITLRVIYFLDYNQVRRK